MMGTLLSRVVGLQIKKVSAVLGIPLGKYLITRNALTTLP